MINFVVKVMTQLQHQKGNSHSPRYKFGIRHSVMLFIIQSCVKITHLCKDTYTP